MTPETDTLRMLAEAADGLLQPDGARIRALRGKPPGFDRALWEQMAEQGWLSIMAGEADGGLGLGIAAAAVVAERLGHAAAPEPFVAAGVMAPWLVAQSKDAAQRQRLLPGLISGAAIATVACQGRTGNLAAAECGVTAKPSGGGGIVLSGEARFVPVAEADAFIVAARGLDGLGLYWLEQSRAGLSRTPEPAPDGTASATLRLADVALPAADRLALGKDGEALLTQAIDLALVAASAELVGNMERQIALTLDYLRTRKQFGQAIGSFQALQHRAVDLWMHKELARHATDAAVRILADPAATAKARTAAASSAKYRACESALLVAKQAIQLHGAIGFTDEYDLGLYTNRAVPLVAWLGNAALHRQRYAAHAAPREPMS
jgi:alkylation response protein AidB-like acyl-CoA dehydrogenase